MGTPRAPRFRQCCGTPWSNRAVRCGAASDTLAKAALLDDGSSGRRSALALERDVVGCVLANGPIDAFPGPPGDDARWQARGAPRQSGCRRRSGVHRPGEPSSEALAEYFDRLALMPGDGCVTEVNLAALEWVTLVARLRRRGAVMVLDYGYHRRDLLPARGAPLRDPAVLSSPYRLQRSAAPHRRARYHQSRRLHEPGGRVRRPTGTLGMTSQASS